MLQPDVEELARTLRAERDEALLKSLRGAGLAGARLRGADLSEADLRETNLSEADLKGANLRSANLSNADLKGADLRGADLESANLRESDLRNADLSSANLKRANLYGADLSWANLGDADLQDADLRRANVVNGELMDADLRCANLEESNLMHATLIRADLRLANLYDAILSEADLWGAKLHHAKLGYASLGGARLSGADLSNADLNNADLSNADLHETQLVSANLEDADLRYANLKMCNLIGADLNCADLSEADLRGAELSGADLRGVNLGNTTVHSNVLAAADLHSAIVDWRTVGHSLRMDGLLTLLTRTGMPDVVAIYLIDSVRSIDATDLFTMLQSVFLSYGRPDHEFAERLRNELTENGVKTWFYPRDAEFGARHHRHIQTQVHKYDRLVLCCSEASLKREGVLHEIEEVLEREQDEGGTEIMIPILLCDLFASGRTPPPWWPEGKEHIYLALRRRVAADFRETTEDRDKWSEQVARLLKALKKRPEKEMVTEIR